MTQTQNSTATTTRIRRGDKIALSISYDFIALGISMPMPELLRSQVDQAILQWWNSLKASERSEPLGRELNLTLSARYQ